MAESAEGGTLLRCYMGQPVSWVRIPPSPNLNPPKGGFFSMLKFIGCCNLLSCLIITDGAIISGSPF